MVSFGKYKILLTGDLEEDGEMQLVKNNEQKITHLSILKVGHHGSKTSSAEAFLKHTKPSLSIFSTGLNNRYKHPSQEVVERFQKLGLPTLNTAEVGSIELKMTKENCEITTTSQLVEMKKALSK